MKHHIVAIGVSKHKNQTVNLAYAEKDAAEFFNLFKQNINNIGHARLLVDEEATLSEIKTALGKELQERISAEDAFFFFYSGHGALINDPKAQDSALSFLVPYDATHDIANTCLSVDDIKNVFASLKSKANLMFIDSCFSGSVSKNSKSYPVPNTKGFKKLKSFTNMVMGNGSMVFTASKDDELSLEDPEYKNGLFTHFVLEELQKKRSKDSFSATEIFSPIVNGVSSRAKDRWHHIQTPTLLGKLEGDLTLPVFKKSLRIKLETIEIPKTPELQSVSFAVPIIDLTISEENKIIQETVKFVIDSTISDSSTFGLINFEKLCNKLTHKIKSDWELTFQKIGQNVNKIPEAISSIEGNSYQFMILGAAVATYGSEKQMQIYADYLTSLLELTKNKSGLIALIAVPEVVIVEAIYIITTICVARDNFMQLQVLLGAKFDDPNYFDLPPMTLLENNKVHFTRALTGHATKVNDHIREYLKSQDWLFEFAPKAEGKIENYQLQANFLLVILTEHIGEQLWPDFARFYPERIMPLVKKILYNSNIRQQLAKIMNVKEDEVRKKLSDILA